MKIFKSLTFFAIILTISLLTGCDGGSSGGGSGSGGGVGTIVVSDVEITGISADGSSITIEWTNPNSTGLDHIDVVGTGGIDEDILGSNSCNLTGLSASTEYKISLVSSYIDGQTSDGNVVYVSTTAGAVVNHTAVATETELEAIETDDLDGDYFLTDDVTLTSEWDPIGDNSNHFTGTFNGNGHTVSNFSITGSNSYVGFFGYIENAKISNLDITGTSITGAGNVGGIAGHAVNSTIVNCSSSVAVNCTSGFVGGIIGFVTGSSKIESCFSTGNVTGTSEVGGITGYNSAGIITKCYSTGNITGTDTNGHIAGITATNSGGTISYCYSTGDITAASGNGVAGIASWGGDIYYCYSTGDISGDIQTAGITGWVNPGNKVENCYSISIITGNTNSAGIGGASDTGGEIKNCFFAGTVDSAGSSKSGILNDGGTVTNSYYDTAGASSSYGGTGYTTAQLKDSANFSGWDFDNVWDIDGTTNNGFPFLRNMP